MEQVYEQPGKPVDPKPGPVDTTDSQAQGSLFRDLLAFIGRRLIFGIAVLMAIIFLTYFAFADAQGTSVTESLQQATPETAAYVFGLLQGDLGFSQPASVAFRPQPILEIIPETMMRSLGLIGITFLLSTGIGVPLGIWAALHKNGKGALAILIVSFVGISTPVFFLALFLQIAAIE